MLSIKLFHMLLYIVGLIALCKNHSVDASIMFKRFADDSFGSQVVLLEPITVLENPFARRSSHDKKDQSGNSGSGNSGSGSGSDRGPKLPAQPPRKNWKPYVHKT
ncbi:uncharacterized protein FA14DRAFT_177761 [Meira miltonrushii]|uniref:Uncharacterized protein n=1 Tax=Meira miltonrushii TaxID=1280837 RepID=A0A316VLT7_9BASI|nr:uncharacterized protein FA14DRAFT_177761 [Meira miltonrushii]PWN38487.1 hypothetical protein FA14DRAFT_177761 [Meira miltonrushii]